MCLAIPMQVIEIAPDGSGVCDADGSRLPVNLRFIDEPRVGDYVIVHAGYAIERWDTGVAEDQLAELRALTRAFEGLAPLPDAPDAGPPA